MAKKWRRGEPYKCNQCGRKCIQGIKHVCTKSLSFQRPPKQNVVGLRLDVESNEYTKRMADGFAMMGKAD